MVDPIPAGVTAGALAFGMVLLAWHLVERFGEQLRRRVARAARWTHQGREQIGAYRSYPREVAVARVAAVQLAAVNALQVYSAELAGEHDVGVN